MNFVHNKKSYKLILLCIAGSRLYGTNNENSDFDYRGIFISDFRDKLGIEIVPEQISGEREIFDIIYTQNWITLYDYKDITLFELKKFVTLAAQNNPNIIDILCMPKTHILYSSKEWDKIYDNRNLFLSKKIKHTFLGYVHSQLHRMITFDGKDLTSNRAISIKKYGYDVKNAMHLCRLLLSAKEILETETYNPILSLKHRKFLIEVKNGKYSYDYIVNFSNKLEKECDELYEKTSLQNKPQLKKINELLIKLSL